MLFKRSQIYPKFLNYDRTEGHDLFKLLFFVEMNAISLRNILKKFDKRFGYRFTDYYVKTRANHPYSQLQQVFKPVVIQPSLSLCICLFANPPSFRISRLE